MRPKTNRLLMLLIGASLAGCASQTGRSSAGTAGQDTQVETQVEYEQIGGTNNVVTQEELERRAAAEATAEAASPQAAAAEPEYEPQREEVQYIDRPLEETPAPAAAPTPAPAPTQSAAADEALPDFPITKYEIEDQPAEEVEDLGTQPDDSGTAQFAEEELATRENGISEPTEFADEPVRTTIADEPAEVEDLGTQPDDSGTAQFAEEELATRESGISEPTEFADEPVQATVADEPAEVEDLGTQPDESGTASYPEDERASSDSGIGEPTTYPDEPVQQAAAPAPMTVSVNFEAEPLFNFDKSQIRSDQRQVIDEFVASLQGIEYDEISVVGHADRIGSNAYNQKLSLRRANSVKAYMVRQGIPADRIRAEGRGESEPVAGDNCNGEKGKAFISCLQPDRRVDVVVNGNKSN